MKKYFKNFSRIVISVILVTFCSSTVFALPQISDVANGSAQVAVNQNDMTINASDNAIVNYSSFDVGQNESVTIILPSSESRILNRVLGSDISEIFGKLSSNGLFILINPNGIHIGPLARMNMDNLILSTRSIKDQDFLKENYFFEKTGEKLDRLLLNEGNIHLREGGFGVLIAGGINNSGTITASLGKIALASGDAVRLDLTGTGLISVAVEEKTASTIYDLEGNPITDQIKNSGTISADGGVVILAAESLDDLFTNTINLDGIVRADVASNEADGSIALLSSGNILSTGILSAQGGQVELKADGKIVSHGFLQADILNEDGASFDIGGTFEAGQASINNLDGAVNLSTGIYSGTISDAANIIVNNNAVLSLSGNTILKADSSAKGTGQFTMNPDSSVEGNGYDLTISSAKNSNLRSIAGVRSLTLNRSTSSKNPIYVANNNISSANTSISAGVILQTGATSLTTSNLSIAGTLTAGDGSIAVNESLSMTGSGILTQGTSDLSVRNNISLSDQAKFNKSTDGTGVVLNGTGRITDKSSAKQDFGNVVIEGEGVVRTLGAAVKMSGLTVNSGSVFFLNGNDLQFSTAAAVNNNGIIRLQGSEIFTNVANLDIDSGLVEYLGNANTTGNTYTLHDFGSMDFYNLNINPTDIKDIVQLNAAKSVAGFLNVGSGTLNLNGNDLSVAGAFSNNTLIRLKGNETVALSSGNDIDSGTWEYFGTGTYSQLSIGNYYHLSLTGSGGVWNAATDTIVNGNFNIADKSVFNSTNLTTQNISLSGTLNAGNGTVRVNQDLNILGSGTLNQGTSILSVGKNVAMVSGTTFRKSTDGKNFILTGTGTIQDSNSTKQDLGNLVIGGFDTTQTLKSLLKITSLTVQSGNTLSFQGYGLQSSALASVNNDGTIRLRGNEVFTNLANLDIDSGLVEYLGNADGKANTFTVHDFGATDFFDVKINTSDANDTFQLKAAKEIAGDLSLQSGSLNLNGQPLHVVGNFSNDTTVRVKNTEKATLDHGNDLDSGSWQYLGKGNNSKLGGGNDYYNLFLAGSGTWIADGDMNIHGFISIGPNVNFSDAGKNIFLGGNWANTGKFFATGAVVLNGGDQTISGATTFNNLTKISTGPDKLTFENGKTQGIRGRLTLRGQSSSNRLSLRSSSEGSAWNLLPAGTLVVANLDIKDSNVLTVNDIPCTSGCLDSLGNTHWLFFPGEITEGEEGSSDSEAIVVVDQTIGLLPVEEFPEIILDPHEFPHSRGRGPSRVRFEKLWVPETVAASSAPEVSSGLSAPNDIGNLAALADASLPSVAPEGLSQEISAPTFASEIIAPPEEISTTEVVPASDAVVPAPNESFPPEFSPTGPESEEPAE